VVAGKELTHYQVLIEKGGINTMKIAFRVIFALVMALTLATVFVTPASATPGEQNGDSLAIVQPRGGAYVIVTNLEAGRLDFMYGWNNSKAFEPTAVGYWIGVYDVTDSHYEWTYDTGQLPTTPKMLKLWSIDETELISGHDYYINFFVRATYGPETNTATLILEFTAP
jgi:hypothetical protein